MTSGGRSTPKQHTRAGACRRRRGFRGKTVFGVVGVLSALLTSCVAGDPAEPAPWEPPLDWPSRDLAQLDTFAARIPESVPADIARQSGTAPDQWRDQPRRDVLDVAVSPPGVVITLSPDEAPPDADRETRFETPDAEFLVLTFHADPTEDPAPCTPLDNRLPATPDLDPADPNEPLSFVTLARGVRWRLYLPEPDVDPVGLVIHLGGNKYVRNELLARGYAVLHSAGTGRYWARLRRTVDARLDDDNCTPVAVGRQLAAQYDDIFADWPYSLDALLPIVAERYPRLPGPPLPIMGFSIGAIGLPATVACRPERFGPITLIAGGANLHGIGEESSQLDSALNFFGPRAADEAAREAINTAYLNHTELDPYSTAGVLRSKPLLIYHAALDVVVPAEFGNLLHERLGAPDRRVRLVGHALMLQIVMRLEAAAVVDWMEAHMRE